MILSKLYGLYDTKDYKYLIKNIGYYLKKIDYDLNKKQFRNKCSQQSLRICLKIISRMEKQNFIRSDLLFKIILIYHKYWQ